MNMNRDHHRERMLALAAVGEAATGVALLSCHRGRQSLLGVNSTAVTVARVAGIALIGLALACGL